MKKIYSNFLTHSFFLTLLIIGVTSCRPDPKDDVVVGQSKDEFNIEDQMTIGAAIDNKIEELTDNFEILEKSNYQEMYIHLNTLIMQIANTVTVERREDFDWKISVLRDDNQKNAFMTPGGHLYIYSGFLKFMQGEHELVGMIAHEMAYADSDMLINQLQNEYGNKNLSKVLSNTNDSDAIKKEIATGIQSLNYTEIEVMKADEFCAEIICEFVWDGDGLLSILKRGEALKPFEWLSTKATSDHRVANLNHLVYDGIETCGTPDSTFHQRYLEKIVNKLP